MAHADVRHVGVVARLVESNSGKVLRVNADLDDAGCLAGAQAAGVAVEPNLEVRPALAHSEHAGDISDGRWRGLGGERLELRSDAVCRVVVADLELTQSVAVLLRAVGDEDFELDPLGGGRNRADVRS